MSFAERLSWKLGIKNVTESQVYEDFMTDFTDADHADVEARNLIFERLAADFSCEIGKVSVLETVGRLADAISINYLSGSEKQDVNNIYFSFTFLFPIFKLFLFN